MFITGLQLMTIIELKQNLSVQVSVCEKNISYFL